jgi:probable phosphoglycerate mutase
LAATENDMMLRPYLVRHGETTWSLCGQHTGRTDLPLTARGEEEARNREWPLATMRVSFPVTSAKSVRAWSVFRDGCPNGEMPDQVAARAERLTVVDSKRFALGTAALGYSGAGKACGRNSSADG